MAYMEACNEAPYYNVILVDVHEGTNHPELLLSVSEYDS